MSDPRLFLVVLAGGMSTRARSSDSAAPKQFRDVGGGMVFVHGLRELGKTPGLVHVVVVVPDPWRALAESALKSAALPVPWTLAAAGDHRTASTWSGLRALMSLAQDDRPADDDLVAVHDAARPFATRHLLARAAEVAARRGAAVPGIPVADTVVQLTQDDDPDAAAETTPGERPVAAYLQRPLLAAVQTPQVACWEPLREAHSWAAAEGLSFTDDGGLLARRGLAPVVVMGEAGNWKITTDDDWQRAAELLRR